MPYYPAGLGAKDLERDERPLPVTTQPTFYGWPETEPEPLPTITPVVFPEEDYQVNDATYVEPLEPIYADQGSDPYAPVEAGFEIPNVFDVAAEEDNPWMKYGLIAATLYIAVKSYQRSQKQ